MGKWLKNIFGLAVLAFLVWYLAEHWDELKVLPRFNLNQFAVMFFLCFLTTAINAGVVRSLINALGTKTDLWDMVCLNNAAILLNYAPMKFGTIFRANYLNRHYGLAYSHFATFFLYIMFLMTTTAATVGLVVLVAIYGVSVYENQILAIVFLITIVGSLMFLFVPLPIPTGKRRLTNIIRIFLTGRADIAKQKKTILNSAVLLILTFLLETLRLGVIYHSMGIDVHPAGLLILGALGLVTLFVSITPGSLGIREFVLGAGAVVLGVPLEVGVLAAMIDRAILVAYAFSVGGGSALYLWRKSPGDFKKQNNGSDQNGLM